MLLTLTAQTNNAADLGYLLYKNPANPFEKEMWFGKARVFYPEVTLDRCTAALLLEVDPVGLVRGPSRTAGLDQYVNDRPYVASSMMSVAIGEVFRTAMTGVSKDRPERAAEPMDLTATLSAVDCDAGENLIRRLWEPLGYQVELSRLPLDDRFPAWGESSLYRVTLRAQQTVQNVLTHLYVLIPVMDNAKHYYVDAAEIDKLVRRGEGWLAVHPEKELIARRYLAYKRQMVQAALEQLRDETATDEPAQEVEEKQIEAPARLNEARMNAVMAAVRAMEPPARRVIDLGCGEGRLLQMLMKEREIKEIVGMDISSVALNIAERRLKLERLPERQQERIKLIQGSLVYRDERFAGFDAALLVEVIEHVDPQRLSALEHVVFKHARPRRVIVTTPNADYNNVWASLPAGQFRHRDHRFEWSRPQFREWAERVAGGYRYSVTFQGIGPEEAERGSPTQMGVFDRG